MEMLPGEGEVKFTKNTRVRVECDGCGAPAIMKHTYLMPNARNNPSSAAYGKDDCSWCSDFDLYQCGECDKRDLETQVPDAYRWCSTFPALERYQHLFLKWREEEILINPTMRGEPAMEKLNTETLEAINAVANGLRGASLDPRLPDDFREWLAENADKLDNITGRFTNGGGG